MARWFKMPTQSHPAIIELIDSLGYEGYGMLAAILAEMDDEGTISPKLLCRMFGINSRKAERILPTLEQCLTKVCQSLGKVYSKFSEVRPNFHKSSPKFDQSLSKHEASIPLEPISVRSTERIERENREREHHHDDYLLQKNETVALLTANPAKVANLQKQIVPQGASVSADYWTKGIEFFHINRNGSVFSEEGWILQQLCSKANVAASQFDFKTFFDRFPSYQKTYNRWIKHPLHVRMTAFALIIEKTNADNELTYATSIIERHGENNALYQENLVTFAELVANGDKTVEVSC